MWPSCFVFATCQPGMEAALKRELARKAPLLRPAFLRPGFVTLKAPEPVALDARFEAVFARAAGVSVLRVAPGKGASTEALAAATSQALQELGASMPELPRALRLHVFEREAHVPGEEPLGFVVGAQAGIAEEVLLAADAETRFLDGSRAEPGETVLDVIVVEPDVWWLGAHTHNEWHSPHPGGRPPCVMPAEAPSRAYRKLHEALEWSALPLRPGDTAVELGSAPGGASYGLLERGLRVVGIDPAAMDPRVVAHPDFVHIQVPVHRVPREDLPEQIEWLLLDINLGPEIALTQVGRLSRRMERSLCGVLLTLKLNEPRFADDVPAMLEMLWDMGFSDVRAAQLPSHRRELAAMALTPRGRARLGR